MADVFIVGGFVLLVVGVGLLSMPWACIVAGLILFLAGVAGYLPKD